MAQLNFYKNRGWRKWILGYFRHVDYTIEGRTYGYHPKTGCYDRPARDDHDIQLEVSDRGPLPEVPASRLPLDLHILLSLIHPSRFKNCVTALRMAHMSNKRTPDGLFMDLATRRQR